MLSVKIPHILLKLLFAILFFSTAFGSQYEPETQEETNDVFSYPVNAVECRRLFKRPSNKFSLKKMKYCNHSIEHQLQKELDALFLKIEAQKKSTE